MMASSLRLRSPYAAIVAAVITVSVPTSVLAQTPVPSDRPQTGCVSGYPNGTYQGDRPISRNEFAAGVDSCLNSVDSLLRQNRGNAATTADLDSLIQRQRELNIEIHRINDRLETLGR